MIDGFDSEPGGVPVVFLHGWGGSSRSAWGATSLPDRLRRLGRRTLVLDLPGHGTGAGSHASADYDAIVDQVEAALPAGPVDLVGYSLGAKIALMIAARRPSRVRRLALAGVGENVFSPEPGGEAVREAMVEGFGPTTTPAVRASVVYALQSGGDPAAIGACLCRHWEPPTEELLRTLRTPVLLVNGSEDHVIRSPDRLADCLPDVDVHVLDGIDHFATPYAAALHELVEEFVAGALAPTGR